jgi:predicted tellurium resistance membrane protein TerC
MKPMPGIRQAMCIVMIEILKKLATMHMDVLFQAETWAAFFTLAALEIVLGVDNIIFLSITTSKLPAAQQPRARTIGLAGAMLTRILLLLTLSWIMTLTQTWVTVLGEELSGRDFILLLGGLFLIGKSAQEIYGELQFKSTEESSERPVAGFWSAIAQIMVLDVVFSLDSVITAVGMTHNIPVMIAAIVASVIVMMFFASAVANFVDTHPTIRMLALAFLVLIGAVLVAESLDFKIAKAYIYSAMAFSLAVELLNLKLWARVTKNDHAAR